MEFDRRAAILTAIAGLISEGASAQTAGAREGSAGSAPPPSKGLIRKAYAKSRIGQIHYRYVDPPTDTGKPPVVFFHPNPFSGIYFNPTLEELGRDRRAIAFDSPGYGESARPAKPATMEEVGQIFIDALTDMGYGAGKKVDVSGFHTGAYIAPEIAAAKPDLVRKVVISGVPFWEGETREAKRKELLGEHPVTEDGASVMYEWKRWVAGRNKLLPLERAYEIFTSAVIAGERIWWAYYGVVNYDARPRFQQVEAPVLMINPSGEALAVTTRLAAPLFKKGKLLEVPELPHQIYDLAVPQVGKMYREFLDA